MTGSLRRSAQLWGVVCLLLVCALDQALAQFGLHRSAPAAAPGGFAGWILAEQARFYLMLSSTLREAKANGSAAYTLLGISFIYGIFHAAGPGHGKAVISSYLVANDETWKRGIALSFAAAILQAVTAVERLDSTKRIWRHNKRTSRTITLELAEDDAQAAQDEALAQHHAADVPAPGAEDHAHPDLPSPLGDGVRGHAVNADGAQQQGHDRGHPEERQG